ncbi:MAG: adenylate/guanylate cyclase domain-containing protein [Chloroflexi bacterium]|nr:adenylate/guanylate cyclase domain-containing protein [Chloroflexota bacterium]
MHAAFLPALDGPIEAKVLIGVTDCVRWFQNAQGRESAEVFALLDEMYHIIDQAVEAAGGLVVKYIGDGALVVFPEEQADPGIMALLSLKREIDAWLRERGWDSGLNVNLHFGKLTMGKMGSVAGLDVIGEAVNVCARLPHQGVTLTPQAFRRLSPEHRRLFHRHAPPITYHPER